MALEASLCQLRASEKHIHPASEKQGTTPEESLSVGSFFLGASLAFFLPAWVTRPFSVCCGCPCWVSLCLWVGLSFVCFSVLRCRLSFVPGVASGVCFPGFLSGFLGSLSRKTHWGFFSRVADAARESE